MVGASTDHHHNLHKHPSVPIPSDKSPADASACPALKNLVQEPKSQEMDDQVCPVVGMFSEEDYCIISLNSNLDAEGTASTVLPPDHPSTEGKDDDVECPVTKAKVGHHKGKLVSHPDVHDAKGVCPVAGVKAQ